MKRHRAAPACHSANPAVRATKEAQERVALTQRARAGVNGLKPYRKLSKRGRRRRKAKDARLARINISRRQRPLMPEMDGRQGHTFKRLVQPDGSKDEGTLTALDKDLHNISTEGNKAYVAAWSRSARSLAGSSACAFRFEDDLTVELPSTDDSPVRTITVRKVVCTDVLPRRDVDALFKINITPQLLGLWESSRGSSDTQLPPQMMGGVLPPESWAPNLLGFSGLKPDESFVLYAQDDPDVPPRFVCCVLRKAVEKHPLRPAAGISTAGLPRDWYLWNKGCGASGLPTARQLRAMLDVKSSVASRYFGNDKCGFRSCFNTYLLLPQSPLTSPTSPSTCMPSQHYQLLCIRRRPVNRIGVCTSIPRV